MKNNRPEVVPSESRAEKKDLLGFNRCSPQVKTQVSEKGSVVG